MSSVVAVCRNGSHPISKDVVEVGGVVRAGDPIEVHLPDGDRRALEPV